MRTQCGAGPSTQSAIGELARSFLTRFPQSADDSLAARQRQRTAKYHKARSKTCVQNSNFSGATGQTFAAEYLCAQLISRPDHRSAARRQGKKHSLPHCTFHCRSNTSTNLQMSDVVGFIQPSVAEASSIAAHRADAFIQAEAAWATAHPQLPNGALQGTWITLPGPMVHLRSMVADYSPQTQLHLVLVAPPSAPGGRGGSSAPTTPLWLSLAMLQPGISKRPASLSGPAAQWRSSSQARQAVQAESAVRSRIAAQGLPNMPHMHGVTVPGTAGWVLRDGITPQAGWWTPPQDGQLAVGGCAAGTVQTCTVTGNKLPSESCVSCVSCGHVVSKAVLPSAVWVGPAVDWMGTLSLVTPELEAEQEGEQGDVVLSSTGLSASIVAPLPPRGTAVNACTATDEAAACRSLAVPAVHASRNKKSALLEPGVCPGGLEGVLAGAMVPARSDMPVDAEDLFRLQSVAGHLPVRSSGVPQPDSVDAWVCSECRVCDTCGASTAHPDTPSAWQSSLLAPPAHAGVLKGDEGGVQAWRSMSSSLPPEPAVLAPRWAVQCSQCIAHRGASSVLTCAISRRRVPHSAGHRMCVACEHPVVAVLDVAPPPAEEAPPGTPLQPYACMACRAALARQLWCVAVVADKGQLFYAPVTADVAPGYFSVVDLPMDLSTMREHLARGGYHVPWDGLQVLRDHMALIARNAMVFNEPTGRVCRDTLRWFRSVSGAFDSVAPWTHGDAYAGKIHTLTESARSAIGSVTKASQRALPRLPQCVMDAVTSPHESGPTQLQLEQRALRVQAMEALVEAGRKEAAAAGADLGGAVTAEGGVSEGGHGRLSRKGGKGGKAEHGAGTAEDELPIAMGLPEEYRVVPRASPLHPPNAIVLTPLAGLAPRDANALSLMDLCGACGSSGDVARMLLCVDCGEAFHSFCLALDDDAAAHVAARCAWRCPNCKVCETTGHASANSDSELLYCERCSGGYAMSSLQPPLKSVPAGKWVCASCVDAVGHCPDPRRWVALPHAVTALNTRSVHTAGLGSAEALGVPGSLVGQAAAGDLSVASAAFITCAVVEGLAREGDMQLALAELEALETVAEDADAAYSEAKGLYQQATAAVQRVAHVQNLGPALVQRGLMADHVAHRVQETYLYWARRVGAKLCTELSAEFDAAAAGIGAAPDVRHSITSCDVGAMLTAECTEAEHTVGESVWGDTAKAEASCPLCLQQWYETDAGMIMCDLCHMWVHGRCETPPVDGHHLAALEMAGDSIAYVCAGCRGQRAPSAAAPPEAVQLAMGVRAFLAVAGTPGGAYLFAHAAFVCRAELVQLLPGAVETARRRAAGAASEAAVHARQLVQLRETVTSTAAAFKQALPALPGALQSLYAQAKARVTAARASALAATPPDPSQEMQDQLWCALVALQDSWQREAKSAQPQAALQPGACPLLPALRCHDAEPWWVRRVLCGDSAAAWVPKRHNAALRPLVQQVAWAPPRPLRYTRLPDGLSPAQCTSVRAVLAEWGGVWGGPGDQVEHLVQTAPSVPAALAAAVQAAAAVPATKSNGTALVELGASSPPATPQKAARGVPDSGMASPVLDSGMGLDAWREDRNRSCSALLALGSHSDSRQLPEPPSKLVEGDAVLVCLPPLLPICKEPHTAASASATANTFNIDGRVCAYSGRPEAAEFFRFDIGAALNTLQEHTQAHGPDCALCSYTPSSVLAQFDGVGRSFKGNTDALAERMAALSTPPCLIPMLQGIEGRLLPVPSTGGEWVADQSALWSSDVVVGAPEAVLYGVHVSLRKAARGRCAACGQPGASVACAGKGCAAVYHLSCGVAAGVCFDPLARVALCPSPKCVPFSLPELPRVELLPPQLRRCVSKRLLTALSTVPLEKAALSIPQAWVPHMARGRGDVVRDTLLHLPMSLVRTWHSTIAIWSWAVAAPFTVATSYHSPPQGALDVGSMTPGGVPLVASLAHVPPLARGPPLIADLSAVEALRGEEGGAEGGVLGPFVGALATQPPLKASRSSAVDAAVGVAVTSSEAAPDSAAHSSDLPVGHSVFDCLVRDTGDSLRLQLAQRFILRGEVAEADAVEGGSAAHTGGVDTGPTVTSEGAMFSVLDALSQGAPGGAVGAGALSDAAAAGAGGVHAAVPCVRVGGLTVLRWGRVVPHVPGFHSEHMLFPIGYTARRVFWAPGSRAGHRCTYTLTVEARKSGSNGGHKRLRGAQGAAPSVVDLMDDGDLQPVFVIRCDAAAGFVVRGSSPNAAFRALRRTLSLPQPATIAAANAQEGSLGSSMGDKLWPVELAHPHGGCMPHLYGPTWARIVRHQKAHFHGMSPLEVACVGSRFSPRPRALWGGAYGTGGADFFGLTIPHIHAVLETAPDAALAMVVPVKGHTTSVKWPRYQYQYLDPPSEFAAMARIRRDELAAAAAANASGAARCERVIPPPPLEELLKDPLAYLQKEQLSRRAGVLAARLDNLDGVPGAEGTMLCFAPEDGEGGLVQSPGADGMLHSTSALAISSGPSARSGRFNSSIVAAATAAAAAAAEELAPDSPSAGRNGRLDLVQLFQEHTSRDIQTVLTVRRSPIHGWGLFARVDIPQDTVVIEYTGAVMRQRMADQAEHMYNTRYGMDGSCYLFRIDDDTIIDATFDGGPARFMNHCCDPNCYSRVANVSGEKRILILAKRTLRRGEEITYDYKFPYEPEPLPCYCGAEKCRGRMN